MKYLVTGGAGFIGSHLVMDLVRKGHSLVILDDLSSSSQEKIRSILDLKNIQFIQGSVCDLDLLISLSSEGIDGIFHEAGLVSVQDSIDNPKRNHEINITGTFHVLHAAALGGVPKVILASSAAIYGATKEIPHNESMIPHPLSPYALAKETGEHYGSIFNRLYGVQVIALRYFNVYGPGQDPHSPYSGVISRFIRAMSMGEPVRIFGDGEQTRDFIHLSDVIRANIRAMESSCSGVFNIGTGVATSINKLVEILEKCSGTRIVCEYFPERNGEVRHSVAYMGNTEQELLFQAEMNLEEGLVSMRR